MPCLEGAQREDYDGREAGIEVVQDCGKGGRFRPPFFRGLWLECGGCLASLSPGCGLFKSKT